MSARVSTHTLIVLPPAIHPLTARVMRMSSGILCRAHTVQHARGHERELPMVMNVRDPGIIVKTRMVSKCEQWGRVGTLAARQDQPILRGITSQSILITRHPLVMMILVVR